MVDLKVPNTILLNAADERTGSQTVKEALGSGVITPGMLVKRTAGLIAAHNAINGPTSKLFALENIPVSGGIDTDYEDGSTVRFEAMRTGDIVYALVAVGTTAILEDALISSQGDGTVKTAPATPDDNVVFARALEAVDNSAGSETVRIKLEIM